MNCNELINETLLRVDNARKNAGPAPWLVGYDINGIQDYVTANSRPIAMRGASLIIKDFDNMLWKEGAIFSGGGRGVLLVSEAKAQELVQNLAQQYTDMSVCGVIAVATVSMLAGDERASLRWLKLKLQNAKDAAFPPADSPPATKMSQCDRCRTYEVVTSDTIGGRSENLCKRCDTITKRGQQDAGVVDQRGLSLSDLASRGYIAAVSADGNNMGRLFEELDSLESIAVVSEVIKRLFKDAHTQALQVAGAEKYVDPVTGGDDIRVFFKPECVAPYVGALAREIAEGASSFGNLGGAMSKKQADLLSAIGIGVGVTVAGEKTPASSMLQRAHELERSAKRLCLQGTRSAVDFTWVSSGEVYLDGKSLDSGAGRGRRPVSLDDGSWDNYVNKARCLEKVPAAQRAVIAEKKSLGGAEFANLFRYQVARSDKWQKWFKDIGSNWRDSSSVLADMPDSGMLELLRILGRGK